MKKKHTFLATCSAGIPLSKAGINQNIATLLDGRFYVRASAFKKYKMLVQVVNTILPIDNL